MFEYEPITGPGRRFFVHSKEAADYLFFFRELERGQYDSAMYQDRSLAEHLGGFRVLISETVLCKAVDDFLIYASELLALIFRARPEILKSSEKVTWEFVLQHADIEALIHSLVEQKVNKLAYEGMRKLAEYFSDRLKIKLFPDEVTLDQAVLLIEMRNLIVHNGAVVNRIFLERVPSYQGSQGTRLRFGASDVLDHIEFLVRTVRQVDSCAIDKFALPTSLPEQRSLFAEGDGNAS